MPSPIAADASSAAIKPLPLLPTQQLACPVHTPYQDEPAQDMSPPSLSLQPPVYQSRPSPQYRPYTDLPSPSEALSPIRPTGNDDVPLAHLLLPEQAPAQAPAYSYSQDYHLSPEYPLEAPPSYSAAVRQAYHDNLIQNVLPGRLHDVLAAGVDEESGIDMDEGDDISYSVERVVTMLIVAIVLLLMSGLFGWLALGSGMWEP